MSLFSTLNTGASGLGVQSTALSVIGDNIANMSTYGYKASRASFADYMPQNTSTLSGSSTIGSGSGLNTVATLFGQGSMQATSSATDMAISGNGFFVVEDGDETFYTRSGEFYLDDDGYLVTASGYNLQGYNATDGVLSTSVNDLLISSDPAMASATTTVTMSANLSTDAEYDTEYLSSATFDGTSSGDDWDTLDDADFTTSITVYDSLGEAHEVTMAYERTGDSEWSYYVLVDGSEMVDSTGTSGDEDYPFLVASGTLTFDSEGELTDFTQVDTSSTTSWTFGNGAEAQDFVFEFGLDTAGDANDGAITFSGSDSAVSTIAQDGYPMGELTEITVSTDGTITGTYTNGEEIDLGQVVLATFTAQAGLESMGSTLYRATSASGDPALGAAGTGGRGDLYSYALEASNVELEDEFVAMITSQRGYQAAARVISTADETLQELVNLV